MVQAEAGKRRGSLGQRIPLGSGLIGHVARNGQIAFYRGANIADAALKPLLPDTSVAVALPIFYAEHLHGILFIESSAATEFSDEEVLLLRTLADLIAGALHNAVSFAKAQEQAITDGLTGVKTHRFFMEALSAEWKRSTRAARAFALVLMDLDRFKFVNDFYGHLEGDLVLQRVGHILETNCRRSDVVARYGGDEFVILMPETNMEHARQLSSKLRGWVAVDPLLRERNISASFGIACYPLHGSTPQELIQVADASMYLSKHQGGNAVSTADHFDPNEAKKWKRDVLEAYLGVTLKRLFATGSGRVRRNLLAPQTIYGITGGYGSCRRKARREWSRSAGASASGARHGYVAGVCHRCQRSLHPGPFAKSFRVRGFDCRGPVHVGSGSG